MIRKPPVYWEDESYLDSLTAILATDATALKQCCGLLSDNDFKPLKSHRYGQERWVVAERCLNHFRQHGSPIGTLLRADVLEYASGLNLAEHRINKLLAYIKFLKTVPCASPLAVTDKIVRYKSGKLRATVLEEMVELHAAGELTDEKWRMYSDRALAHGRLDSAMKPISGADLYQAEYPAPQFVVNPMLPVGLGMLYARPKMGKTFLSLQLAIAMARGDAAFLGEKLKISGRVLYYALEDTPRRLTNRLRMLAPRTPPKTLANLQVLYQWQGEEALRAELQRERYSLVVIDTLLMVQQQHKREGRDIVADDYGAIQRFSKISQESGVAILLVHHSRKPKHGEKEDMRDVALGSTGTTAPADTLWRLSQTNEGRIRKLEVTGRDVEEQALKIEFSIPHGGWYKVADGVAAEVGGPLQRQIVATLSDAAGAMSAKEIAGALEAKLNSVQATLSKMREGDLVENEKGKWRLCERGC
jgi:hypothetical protein